MNWNRIPCAIREFVNLGACSVKTFVTVSVEDTKNMVVATRLTGTLLSIVDNTNGSGALRFVRDNYLGSCQAKVAAGGLEVHLLGFALAHNESDRARRALSLSSLKRLPAP